MTFYQPLEGEPDQLQQGDLLEGVPFLYTPPLENAQLVASDGKGRRGDLLRPPPETTGVVARLIAGWGMLLSQTCDLQVDAESGRARKPILVARVQPIRELVRDFQDETVKKAVKSVRNLSNPGKAPTLFYLPACVQGGTRLPRSGANLLDVQRFAPSDAPFLKALFRLRLTSTALQALQERCAYCFGRFAAPERLYFSDDEWRWEKSRPRN